MKKILSIIFAVIMMVSVMPIATYAAETGYIEIDQCYIAEDGSEKDYQYEYVYNDGTVSNTVKGLRYVKSTNTLYIEDFVTDFDSALLICRNMGNLNVCIKGENSFGNGYLEFDATNTKLSGDGSVYVTTDRWTVLCGWGSGEGDNYIPSSLDTNTFTGSFYIDCLISDDGKNYAGSPIEFSEDITIRGGKYYLYSQFEDGKSCGSCIYCSGTLKVYGGDIFAYGYMGVSAEGVYIAGGKINGIFNYDAISADKVTVNGGTINLESYKSDGIYAYEVNVLKGNVTINAYDDGISYYTAYKQSGGTVNVTADYAIYLRNDENIKDASFTMSNGKIIAICDDGVGLGCNYSITGGSIAVRSTGDTYGIYGYAYNGADPFDNISKNLYNYYGKDYVNRSGDWFGMAYTTEADTENYILTTVPFNDVKTSDWYYSTVAYCNAFGLLTGTSETTFAPKQTITRAMLLTVLYRIAGCPSVDGLENPFTDVPSGKYYTDAAIWAYEEGITTETKLNPNANVTREQTVTFLYRLADSLGKEIELKNDITGYSDYNSVANWAKDAFAWANAYGIVTGATPTTLNPKGTTIRSHASKILTNYCENVPEFVNAHPPV